MGLEPIQRNGTIGRFLFLESKAVIKKTHDTTNHLIDWWETQKFCNYLENMSDLQKAIYALESSGFHVDRAVEEDNRDAGNKEEHNQHRKTGAIVLRITPIKKEGN